MGLYNDTIIAKRVAEFYSATRSILDKPEDQYICTMLAQKYLEMLVMIDNQPIPVNFERENNND